MKKLLLIVSFVFVSISGFAQQQYVGFQTGINITNVSTNNFFTNRNNRIGLNLGLKYEAIINNISLNADLLYSQQGFNGEIGYVDEFGEYFASEFVPFDYDYLSIPLKIGYVFGNKFKITPRAGFQPSFLVNAKITTSDFENGKKVGDFVHNDTEKAIRFDLAALLELELGYSLYEKTEIFGSISVRRSFTEISNSDYIEPSEMKNKGLSICIGLKYNIFSK